ncbi:MAG: hypothetical protein GDA56_23440 [Hormoscilla sp. GM7CHS1pb]|nr:hypothetical protein [Hormoscilla sp. GM7CHS1pb]
MSTDYRHASDYLKELLRSGSLGELSGKLGAVIPTQNCQSLDKAVHRR